MKAKNKVVNTRFVSTSAGGLDSESENLCTKRFRDHIKTELLFLLL